MIIKYKRIAWDTRLCYDIVHHLRQEWRSAGTCISEWDGNKITFVPERVARRVKILQHIRAIHLHYLISFIPTLPSVYLALYVFFFYRKNWEDLSWETILISLKPWWRYLKGGRRAWKHSIFWHFTLIKTDSINFNTGFVFTKNSNSFKSREMFAFSMCTLTKYLINYNFIQRFNLILF